MLKPFVFVGGVSRYDMINQSFKGKLLHWFLHQMYSQQSDAGKTLRLSIYKDKVVSMMMVIIKDREYMSLTENMSILSP
jgi:hypothetical protein